MQPFMTARSRYFLIISVLVAWCLLISLPSGAQEKKITESKSLSTVLAEGANSLEKDIAAGKTDAEALQKQTKQAETQMQNLGAQIATLKACQAAGELQIKQSQEALDQFSQRHAQVEAQIKDLQEKREQLSKQLTTRNSAFDDLKHEVERLKATKSHLWKSPEIRKSWERYQQLAKQYRDGAAQTLERYDGVLRVLGQESQTLGGVIGELKQQVEVSKKEELLKRQPARLLWESVKQTVKSLLGVPARLTQELSDPTLLKRLGATLRDRWAPLLGLLAVFFILAWIVFQVRRAALPKLILWQTEVPGPGTKIIFKAGEIIAAHLFSISFVVWLALTAWVLGWWQNQAARIVLLGVFTWIALRLGLKLVQAVLAGKDHGGILPLEERTARFYRRHFKFLISYVLILGLFTLNLLDRLGLEPQSSQILAQAFGVGLLVWVLYLIRNRHFEDLRLALPGPGWMIKRGFFLTLQFLLVAVLVVIIVAGLLGFQNLSAYISQAASLIGLVIVLFWVTWHGARAILERAIEPEKGRVSKEVKRREELLKDYYLSIMKVVVTFLVAGAFLLILDLIGIDLTFLSWFFEALTWGTHLGPFHLTLLNLGLAFFAVFLGRWFSRFLKVFLEVRFYPRRNWDESIRYTISNTLHYFILGIALLMALSFLGLSFGDLAIVAGGLGVGIGFGLQNIVNNFISGLILLFERPIKVGDLLVIDGQWGYVKEIRVRSTIFQSFDRFVFIIPNSELISNKILNWTHYGPGINRLTLKVGVSYGSDVRQVTRVLDEVCRANPRVVPDPPPQIYFEAYGDSSLNFNIWVHLQTPSDRIPATHELNSAIFEAFQRLGIEIPFPQRDLHVKNWPDLSTLSPSTPKSES
jgi:potassium efflux system protein